MQMLVLSFQAFLNHFQAFIIYLFQALCILMYPVAHSQCTSAL